jgi:hypothetical protein
MKRRGSANFSLYLYNNYDEEIWEVMEKAMLGYMEEKGDSKSGGELKDDMLEDGQRYIKKMINETFSDVYSDYKKGR